MTWRWAIVVPALFASGCTGSRWARDDVDYGRKYAKHTDDPVRTVKQAVDARHVRGKHGWYGGFAGRDDPFGAGVEAGMFVYPRSWVETRFGGAILAHEGERPISGGGLAGVRVQPPTRLAPFVGVGGYLGWAGWEDATDDFVDNDDDGLIDEAGEDDLAFVAAVVPEVGMHYWINSRLRLTGSADYRFTTSGRETDSLFYGISISLLSPRQSSPARSQASANDDWAFGEDKDAYLSAALPASSPQTEATPLTATPTPDTRGEVVEAIADSLVDTIQSR